MNYIIGYNWKGEWVPVDMTGDSLWVLRGMPVLHEMVKTQTGYSPLSFIIELVPEYSRRGGGQKVWYSYHGFRTSRLRYCSFEIGAFFNISLRKFLSEYPALTLGGAFSGRW